VPEIASLARLYVRPGFLLRRVHQISASIFEDECREIGLTPAQYGALTVLSAHPGIDQSTLARGLGFDKVTMLRVMRVLEARALVDRAPSVINRRNLQLTVSEQGAEVLAQARLGADRAYKKFMAPLSATQQSELVSLLKLVATGLEDHARAPFVPMLSPVNG
jgi:DNA-binding MarR family transcriptional regulator